MRCRVWFQYNQYCRFHWTTRNFITIIALQARYNLEIRVKNGRVRNKNDLTTNNEDTPTNVLKSLGCRWSKPNLTDDRDEGKRNHPVRCYDVAHLPRRKTRVPSETCRIPENLSSPRFRYPIGNLKSSRIWYTTWPARVRSESGL